MNRTRIPDAARIPTARGHRRSGAGFYVWELDRREADDWAATLTGPLHRDATRVRSRAGSRPPTDR